ncbi:MAG: hypothetical protein WBX25_22465 [Rhodomicrobium sp.]
MSMPRTETHTGEIAAYGGLADAAGGIATVVLAIIGLAHASSEVIAAIATIVFGVALLIQGGTMLSEYAHVIFPPGAEVSSIGQFGGGSLSTVFLAGAAGIVLGILALLAVNPGILISAAVIAFGAALMLSSNSVWHLHHLKRVSPTAAAGSETTGSEIVANEMALGSAGVQALAGLAAIILGILGIPGTNTMVLNLVALLVLGGTLILTGSTLSETVLNFMLPVKSAPRRFPSSPVS